MFPKLTKNIRLPLIIIAAAFILFVDVISAVVYAATLRNAYKSIGQKRTERAVDSCVLYINSADSSTYNLSVDSEFVEALVNSDVATITTKLNTTCNYSLRINAVTVYTAKGETFYSSDVTGLPTLEQLKKVDGIKQFVEGSDSHFLSLRTTTMASIYENAVYDEQMGVISCCYKVYHNDNVVGWIFTDILPSTLYSKYIFSEDKFKDSAAIISFDGGHFEYNCNSENMEQLQKNSANYFFYKAETADKLFSVTVYGSKAEFAKHMAIFGSVMLGVSAMLMVLTVVAAAVTAKNVTDRLTKLSDKMNTQKI